MRAKIGLMAALFLCLFASCGKNGNSSQKPAQKKMVIEETRGAGLHLNDTTYYSYDQAGRVTMVKDSDTRTEYTYGSGSSYSAEIFKSYGLYLHEIFFVQSSNVDSVLRYDDRGDTSVIRYIYNGSLPVSETYYDYTPTGGAMPSFGMRYTWDNNGDLITQQQVDRTGAAINFTTYTYQHNPSQPANGYTSVSPASKDLPATFSVTIPSGNALVSGTYTYAFDRAHRVVRQTQTQDNGVVITRYISYY
jgi:hypothetical protein